MASFHPCIAVSSRADGVADSMRSKYVGQLKVRPRIAPLGVTGSFERGEKRTASRDVFADRATLGVAEKRRIGQKKCAILAQRGRFEVSFMDKVKEEAAFQQSVVDSLKVLGGLRALRAVPVSRCGGRFVERDGVLRIEHGDVGDRAPVAEVLLVGREPIEK